MATRRATTERRKSVGRRPGKVCPVSDDPVRGEKVPAVKLDKHNLGRDNLGRDKLDRDRANRYGTRRERDPLSPALLATIITIPIIVIIGFIVYAAMKPAPSGDVVTPIDDYPLTASAAADCAGLVDALPGRIDDFGGKSVDGTTVRWTKDGSDPIVLRCGVVAPTGLEFTSQFNRISTDHGITDWFTDIEAENGDLYVAVNHRPYVALWLPKDTGNGPITAVSDLIADKLTAGDPLESLRDGEPAPGASPAPAG